MINAWKELLPAKQEAMKRLKAANRAAEAAAAGSEANPECVAADEQGCPQASTAGSCLCACVSVVFGS
jgi:hypothetical protein